jgi:hypothetical protein
MVIFDGTGVTTPINVSGGAAFVGVKEEQPIIQEAKEQQSMEQAHQQHLQD